MEMKCYGEEQCHLRRKMLKEKTYQRGNKTPNAQLLLHQSVMFNSVPLLNAVPESPPKYHQKS